MTRKISSFFANLHPLALIFFMVLIAALMTYCIPAGSYDRVQDEAIGKEVVVAGTYHHVEANPTSVGDFLLVFNEGLLDAKNVIAFLLLIGGAMGVLSATGAIDAALGGLVARFGSDKKRNILLAVVSFFFLFCSSTFGMAQEGMVFAPFLIVLMLSLGYDTVVALSTILFGFAIGYAGSYMSPYNLGISQSVCGLPYTSGAAFRIGFLLVMYAIAMIYLFRYAKKVKNHPELSYSPVPPDEFAEVKSMKDVKFTKAHARVWVVFFLAIATLIIGTTKFGFFFAECATVFLFMGILVGVVYGLKPNEIGRAFANGAKDLALPCLIVGFAMSISHVFTDASILDSLVYYLSLPLQHLPPVICAGGMVIVQSIIGFFCASGSSQALITMPIMSPLAHILGVNQQVACLAFEIGDGLTNLFYVTNGTLMIGLGIGGISYLNWAKYVAKLFFILLLVGIATVMIAQAINWGPF